MNVSFPTILIASFSTLPTSDQRLVCKCLSASLARTLYSGRIQVYRNYNDALFKIERKNLDEIYIDQNAHLEPSFEVESQDATLKAAEVLRRRLTREFIFRSHSDFVAAPDQWVIFADSASIALRNLDHLFPSSSLQDFPPSQIDFLFTEAPLRGMEKVLVGASTGLWAVRGKFLKIVVDIWKVEVERLRYEDGGEEEIWSRTVSNLPLKKRKFEKGEVIAPERGAVDWEQISNAAFVTLSDWPHPERATFLQSLYFGKFLSDDTGLVLGLLDP